MILTDLTLQEYLGALAAVIGFVGTIMYIHTVLIGRTKPHLYTWLVFAILTAIGFFAQISDNAGPGAWMMAITALSCATIAAISLKYGEQNITKSDKIALFAALFAIIPWLLTKDPLLSVIMISLIDGVAMYPTIRKSWHKPHEENINNFALANFKTIISLFALTNMTLVTVLYPLSIVVVNCTLIGLCLYRRQVLKTA